MSELSPSETLTVVEERDRALADSKYHRHQRDELLWHVARLGEYLRYRSGDPLHALYNAASRIEGEDAGR